MPRKDIYQAYFNLTVNTLTGNVKHGSGKGGY